MKLTFIGAAKEVTGSMHLLEVNGRYYLLDCGLVQGKRKLAFEKNRQLAKRLPVDPSQISAVFLSHSHVDHTGNIPTLVKLGFTGTIYCTDAAKDLCQYMLNDSGYLQERDVQYVNKKRAKKGQTLFEPLYTQEDAAAALKFFQSISYEHSFQVGEDLTVTYHEAGHLLGSAIIEIVATENGQTKKLVYSGDLGRKNVPIIRNSWQVQDADILVMEVTYANRFHEGIEEIQKKLTSTIHLAVKNKSKVIVPSFSVGRTQHLVYELYQLMDKGLIPRIPIYVDSPLSVNATSVYAHHPECYDKDTIKILAEKKSPFGMDLVTYTKSLEESMALNKIKGPVIIISSSGMCEGGRILHHLKHSISDPNNFILIIGFMAQHTTGRRILEKKEQIKIFGTPYDLRARVIRINAFSAHKDQNGLLSFVTDAPGHLRKICLVHAEEQPAMEFAELLSQKGYHNVTIPDPGESIEL